MASRKKAEIEITANASKLPAGLRQATTAVGAFARHSQTALSAMHLMPQKNQKRWWIQHAAGTAVGNVVNQGIAGIVEQGKQIFGFNEQLVRFGIVAHMGGKELDRVGDVMREVAAKTGLSANVIQEGARAYLDMAGASAYTDQKIRIMGRTAQASETDIKTLSEVMFQLQHSMKVPDSQLEDTLGGIIETSKEGAVHFSAMAQEINELAPQAARYGMVGREGVNQLTALMQVARTGFGSVSEMGTGITRVFTGLTMHAKEFREYGVEIFNTAPNGMKTWKTFAEIFKMIRTNNVLSKNPELLRKAFGRSEADRTIRLWMEGVGALEKFEKAGMASGVVQRDLTKFTESSAGRLAIAWEKMRNAAAKAFTPERIERFTSAVEALGRKLEPVVDFVGKIGDTLGAFSDAGKDVNNFLTRDRENKYFGADDYKNYASYGGRREMDITANRESTYEEMRKDWNEMVKMKDEAFALTDGEHPTEASNLLVYRSLAKARAKGRSGQFTANAARSYIDEAGISLEDANRYTGIVNRERISEGAKSGQLSMFSTMEDIKKYLNRTADDEVLARDRILDGSAAMGKLTSAINDLSIRLRPMFPQSMIAGGTRDGWVPPLNPGKDLRSFQVDLDGNKVGQGIRQSTGVRRK